MNALQNIETELAHSLDKLDYRRLRSLGLKDRAQLRKFVADNKWDVPPVHLKFWVDDYGASIQLINIISETGIVTVLQKNSDEIRSLLSLGTLPAIDSYVVSRDKIEDLIKFAKDCDRFKRLDPAALLHKAPSEDQVADILIVNRYDPGGWEDRPRVDEKVGARRLRIRALIAKAVMGGALTVTNLSLGILTFLSVIPSIAGEELSTKSGLVTSTFTGLTCLFDAIEKISSVHQEEKRREEKR